jgi:hypothetical protein
MLSVGMSWGGPPNNDVSDALGNTAGGTNALVNNTTGRNNTANGAGVLLLNSIGHDNTASGTNALLLNSTGNNNTASGTAALLFNTGSDNTAIGFQALFNNNTGSSNTAIGSGADVSAGNLVNAMAIGAGSLVNASNKIRLGNGGVTVIEGQVAFTFSSDKTKKENFRPVDGEEVLAKMRGFALTSWNFIGHDPTRFRHYGPMAQDFFAAFGHDGVGQIGSETTINAGDLAGILMSAVQALEQRTTELQQKEAQIAVLASTVEDLKAKYASLETVATQAQELTTLKAENARLRAAVVQQQERDAALAARLERLEAAAARAATLASR